MARAHVEHTELAVGYLYALAAALLFGANGSLTKVLLDSGMSGTQVTQFRVLAMCLVCGLILLVVDRKAFRITLKQFGVMVVLGVVGVALLQATYAYAPNGMLATITDPRGNQTTLSDHKRGIPQKISFADSTTSSPQM